MQVFILSFRKETNKEKFYYVTKKNHLRMVAKSQGIVYNKM
jgi:hypothetical protein